MELPPPLRHAVDRALSGVTVADLAAAAAALSQRYREERSDGQPHVANATDALAYVAVRMPATYAAIRASLAAVAAARPDFAPKTTLDVGSGPGTAVWAAADCWPGLAEAFLVEARPVFRDCGAALAAEAPLPQLTWHLADFGVEAIDGAPRDLVTLAYVLNELATEEPVVAQLWRLTADTLVIVEPGTPAGFQRVLAARRQLIAAGAHVLAPCPMEWIAHCCRRIGATLRSASRARASIAKPRPQPCRGRTRSSAMWRYRAIRHRSAGHASLPDRAKPAATSPSNCAGLTRRPAISSSRGATAWRSSARGAAIGDRCCEAGGRADQRTPPLLTTGPVRFS